MDAVLLPVHGSRLLPGTSAGHATWVGLEKQTSCQTATCPYLAVDQGHDSKHAPPQSQNTAGERATEGIHARPDPAAPVTLEIDRCFFLFDGAAAFRRASLRTVLGASVKHTTSLSDASLAALTSQIVLDAEHGYCPEGIGSTDVQIARRRPRFPYPLPSPHFPPWLRLPPRPS